ncbi:outer membrane protein assembly factor BamD [Fulvivirgaceae bacterium BMA10]|uniref:Outer membrane protein assembly factor BamD n=1 Tax=Splendidivirga corallicola TaxID=3051826 RepID=A0ABT8KK95_9BACT|nr:outer membrane protein assembly factor BamD [Fulvivirgaceae bacterium BMA10]
MKRIFCSLAVILLVFTSCSKFRKIERSDDLEKKYNAAIKYYEDEDYFRSSVLFEQILPLLRGDKRAENVQFYYAYSIFHQRRYIESSYYFKVFFETYSRSEFAEESRYMYAYSLYLDSPVFNLDQTSTYDAIEAMQSFLNTHPYSKYKDEANDIINKLQVKLEKKAYTNAKEYYKLRDYDPRNLKAAIIAFENFEKDFPDSKMNEEISYLKVDAKYKLAKLSIPQKQRERYQETIEVYQEFIDDFPDGEFLKKAENIYKSCINDLDKLKSRNNL